MPRLSIPILFSLGWFAQCAWGVETVTLQLKWKHAYQFAGYYMAKTLGYYRDAGLDVVIREGGPKVDYVDAVVSGRAQYGTGSSGLLLERAQGKPVVVLAVIFQHAPDVLIVDKRLGVESPRQLIGKTVMTSPSTPAIAAMLLNEAGTLNKFALLAQTDDLMGLVDRRFDAIAGYLTDQPFFFRERNFPVVLMRPIHYGVDFYGDNLFTTEEELHLHPERVRAMREASLRGWQYAMTHPNETIAVIRELGSQRSAEHLRFEYQAMVELVMAEFIALGHMHADRWRHIADTYARLGLLSPDYSLRGLFYDPNPSVALSTIRNYGLIALGLVVAGGVAIGVLLRFNRRLKAVIRERMEVEQALRSSERRLQEAQSIAHIGSWERDLTTGETFWSPEIYRLLGYTPGEVTPSAQAFMKVVHPEDRERVLKEITSARSRPNGAYQVEFRLRLPNGEIRVVDERGQVSFDGTGQPRKMMGTSLDITERKRVEQSLREQETYLRTIFDNEPECIKLLDREGRLLDMNPAGLAMIEADSLDEVRGQCVCGMVSERDRTKFQAMIDDVFRGESRHLSFEITGIKGARRYLETHSVPLWDSPEHRSVRALLGVTRDITEQRRAEEKLRLAATVFESTREGVLVTDARVRVIAVNRAFSDITGYSEEEVLGRSPRFLASGWQNRRFYKDLWAVLRKTGSWQGELWNRRKNGEIYPEWLTINVVRDERGQITHYVGVFSDISQLKQSQAQLEHLAQHDPLTQLPNRLLLSARMEHALRRAERSGERIAVLFLDLDRFKHINDSLGHNAGDYLLTQVADRLQETVRREDTVARLGGDEFTVVMEDLRNEEDAAKLADKLIHALSHSFLYEGRELFIGASIGISVFPRDGHTVEQLLRNADAAMYHAKEDGRNTYRFYSEELTARAFEHVVIEGQLRRAIEQDELTLYYQPQFDLRNGALVGLEALVRWNHPEQGIVSPARFIPIAEETGLIVPLGGWVLRAACIQGKAWLEQGLHFGVLSVNVAGQQIQRGNLVEQVRQTLAESGLPAHYLELEITESFIMKEASQGIDQLHALRALGIKLAIDDFGTGYSSLAYLKRLPFDKLKIDQSFVRDLPEDENDAAIARAIIALGHSLQFTVIAEGVETPAQRDQLLRDGCEQAQGYLYGRPVPAAEVEGLLKV